MIPPPFPPESVYTSCYCEENVYLLCQKFLQEEQLTSLWQIYVVFISNANKTIALQYQKAAPSAEAPKIWDYHVILILRPRQLNATVERFETAGKLHCWVYDFDTRLPIPCQWEEYFDLTFPQGLLPSYESQFRVILGDQFQQHFASDRSHMLFIQNAIDEGTMASKESEAVYFSSPPTYDPICGPGALQVGTTNNLMSHYVAMSEESSDSSGLYGFILDREGMKRFFTQ